MAKEIGEKSIMLADEVLGEVRIADTVIGNIAVLAAKETDGVSNIYGNSTNELMNKVGVKGYQRGVKVDIIDNVVSVELVLIISYGYNIPVTCKKVQDKVKASIENMTGLEVSDVNIRISGMDFES